MVLFNYSKYR